MSDWVVQLIDAGGYWGIAFLMVLENVFPPIPSELIMGIGGIRVGQGRMEMLPLLVAGTVGTTIGNFSWYLLGYKLGFERLKPLVDRFGRWLTLRWRDVEWLDRCFEKHGEKIDDWLGPLTNVAVGFMLICYLWRLVTWKEEKPER